MRISTLGGMVLALMAWTMTGCGSSSAPTPAPEAETNLDLSGLDAADRELAAAQKVCAVSDEPLGSMGTPIKVTAMGESVFLCCEGCRSMIEAEPQKYLNRLKAKADDE